jgi:hypothetical protein
MASSTEYHPTAARVERRNEHDDVRAEIGRRHLSDAASEIVVRRAMGRTPPALLERARTLLLRYFSRRPWTLNDEIALSAIVGRGEGWHEAALGHELVIQFGWRGGGFKMMCGRVARTDPDAAAPRPHTHVAPHHQRATELEAMATTIAALGNKRERMVPLANALEATFATRVVPESTHDPTIVTFLVAGQLPANGHGWIVRNQTDPSGVAEMLFAAADAVARVMFETGSCTLQVCSQRDWEDCLAPTIMLLDQVAAGSRSAEARDRQAGRLREEMRGLDLHTSAAMQRLRAALLSRDPLERELAVAVFGVADPFAAAKVWRTAIDDSARNVRRAAAKAIAQTRTEALRGLLERATLDVDSCTRFHAVHGLGMIGAKLSMGMIEPLRHDPDARVQVMTSVALRT